MRKNKQSTEKSLLTSAKEFLAGALGVGVVLASTHGALLLDPGHGLSPVDFKVKVTSELHTHSDLQIQFNHLLVDPKHLRSTRSEGDKTAEYDGLRANWDIYLV